MDVLLILLICLSLTSLLWVYLYLRRMNIPLEPSEFFKCFLTSFTIETCFSLSLVLEKWGICSQIDSLRIILFLGPSPSHQDIHVRDEQFDNVPVKIYEPRRPFNEPRRCIIYLHGGVGLLGTTRSYASVCQNLALKTETMVVDVEYRLAPEHRHPAQVEDCMSAVIHFLKSAENYGVNPRRVILAGDSSGATLVSVVCQRLVTRKDLPRIRAQILLYPALQLIDLTLPSYQQNPFPPVLPKKSALILASKFVSEEPLDLNAIMKNAHCPDDLSVKYKKWISADHIPEEFKVRGYVPIAPAPFSEKLFKRAEITFQEDLCPLLVKDDVIRQLPETFLLTCEYDILRDDGLLYKKRLEDNGVLLTWLHLKKGFHGVMFISNCMPFRFKEAENGMEHIVEFVQRC